MSKTLSAQDSLGTIDAFIQEVGAAEKRAADGNDSKDPGTIGGETEHPSKSVPNNTYPTPEGARSKENTKDVKEDQGEPSVENAPEATAKKAGYIDLSRFARPTVKQAEGGLLPPGCAKEDLEPSELVVGPTGDPPPKTPKAGKEDPGSTHPARTDNDEIDGHKWSSDKLAAASLEELAKVASDLGNSLCAALASDDPTQTTQKVASDTDPRIAEQAGFELAGLFTGDFDKRAADALVQKTLQEIIKTAADDGDATATCLDSYFAAQREKVAEGEVPPPDPSQGPPPPPGGGMPPPGGEGGPMMGGPGAGGPPGGAPPPGGDAAMLGALGGAGGGAPPPGGDPSGGGAGDVDPQTLELAKILEQLGVTPEELEQAMQQEGGEGGGLPPEAAGAGGGEEAGAAPPDAGGGGEPKMGADRSKTAAVKKGNSPQEVREYIQEVISRSRRTR